MRDVLFLAHRIPYPPDKGDKIRGWHFLSHIASRYRVHLAAFIDEPDDLNGIERLREVCASVFWRPLSPSLGKLRSLPCLLRAAPLTQGYYYDRRFAAGVDTIIARYQPELFYVFSTAMFSYVGNVAGARVVLDMVDVDSEKWRQYAETSSGPARLVYAREARTLLTFERRAAARADAVVFVSQAEAKLFQRLAPEIAQRAHFIENGVDISHFIRSETHANPMEQRPAIVFTGTMNYRPNEEAMVWFANEVMPRLRDHSTRPCLWIVGANPSRAVRSLAGPDVRVTGRVADVRPYLQHAAVVVAPLQIARGIQNKVLEAMAMGAVVVATPQAREGLDRCNDGELLTASSPTDFAEMVACVLDGAFGEIGARARARVGADYSWQSILADLDRLIDPLFGDMALPVRMPAIAALDVTA